MLSDGKGVHSMPKQPSDVGAMWTYGGTGVTFCMFPLSSTPYVSSTVPSVGSDPTSGVLCDDRERKRVKRFR